MRGGCVVYSGLADDTFVIFAHLPTSRFIKAAVTFARVALIDLAVFLAAGWSLLPLAPQEVAPQAAPIGGGMPPPIPRARAALTPPALPFFPSPGPLRADPPMVRLPTSLPGP